MSSDPTPGPAPDAESRLPTSPAPRTPSDDAYMEYMAGEGDVLHRQKLTWPWYFQMIWPLMLAIGTIGIFADKPVLAPFLMLWIGVPLMWAMFHALRVVVTRDHLFIQFGLLGPKIPIESIISYKADQYDFWKFGGYGIRYSLFERAWAFNLLGDKGKAVRIEYRTRFGGTRRILISSDRPHVLADAINRARRAKGHDVELIDDSALDDLDGLEGEILHTEEQRIGAETLSDATDADATDADATDADATDADATDADATDADATETAEAVEAAEVAEAGTRP